MSNQREILYRIEIDSKSAERRLVEIKKEQDELKASNKALSEQIKKGEKSFEEVADQLAQNEARYKALGAEQSRLNYATKQTATVNDQAAGSLNQMRASLNLLKNSYANLSKEERENEQVGKLQLKQINDLTREIKELEEAQGDYRRNVGNYKESITDALKDLNVFGVRVGDVTDNLNKGKEGFQNYTAGMGKANIAMRALIAVPIIAVLLGVIAVLSQFDDVMDEISAGVDAVTSGFNVFIRGFAPVGRQVMDILKGIASTAIDAVQMLYAFATFDAEGAKRNFSELQESFDGLGKATKSLVDDAASGKLAKYYVDAAKGAIDAAKAQYELTKALQDLEDAENALRVDRAEADKQVRLALITAKDRSKTEQERLNILKNAGELERRVAREELQNGAKRVLFAQKEALLRSGLTHLITDNIEKNREIIAQNQDLVGIQDKYVEAIQETEVAYKNLEAATEEAQQKIANRNATFLEELSQQAREARLRQLEDEKAAIDKQLVERTTKEEQYNEEVLNLKVKALQKGRDIELQNEKLTQNQRALIVAETEFEIFQLRRDYAMRGLEFEQINAAELQKLRDEARQKETEERNKWLQSLMDKDIAARKKNAEEAVKLREKQRKEEIAIEEAKYEAIATITDGLASLANLLAKNQGQAAEFQKVITLFQIGVDTARAISGAVAQAQSVPFPANLAAIATGVATVLANIAQAKQLLTQPAPKPPQFESGNQAGAGGQFITHGRTTLVVGDNPGGRELVTVTPLSGRGETKVNPATGLLQLAGGGTVLSDGGYAVREASREVMAQEALAQLLAEEIKKMPPQELNITTLQKKQQGYTEVRTKFDLQ